MSKDSVASLFGRRGGLVRCKKGLAVMAPEKVAAVREAARAGRHRARAAREAARDAWQPGGPASDTATMPREQAVASLAADLNLTEDIARRRWERESEAPPVMAAGAVGPASMPDASKAPVVTIGRRR